MFSANNESFGQTCEMLKVMPTKHMMNTQTPKSNIRKRHLPMDDTFSLEVKLAQEAKKIIKIKVENDAVNCDLKQTIKTLENDKEIQQQNLNQQFSQYEKLDKSYRSELGIREEVLTKMNNTRQIQNTLECHSLALHKILNNCKEDRQKLSESYEQAIEMLQKMKEDNLKTTKQHQLTIESLKTELTSETQRRLELTDNFKKNSKNMDEFINQLKQQILSLEALINSLKIEKGQMSKSMSDLQIEISKYDRIIKQKDETYALLHNESNQVSDELTKEIISLKDIRDQYIQRVLILEQEVKENNQIIKDKEILSINVLKENDEIKEKHQNMKELYQSSEIEKQSYKEELEKIRELLEKEKDDSHKELDKNAALLEEIRQNNFLLVKELNDCREKFNNKNINCENEKLALEAQLKSLQQSFVCENLIKEKFDEDFRSLNTKYGELKVSLETKIENITKENDELKLEIDEKSIGLTDMMLKFKSLMEDKANSEKVIEEYKNKNELLCEENFLLKKCASEKSEAENNENGIKKAKITQPKSKFDIFDEDNWSCQSDSSLDTKCDEKQHLHFETSPFPQLAKSSTKLLSNRFFVPQPDPLKSTPSTKFSKPKAMTTTKRFFKKKS
ncbi:uncharacterized protein LOC143915833 [Arctopsyche grandis]|uniref:uncharacterized protein LOC143915833 n=1 Tax=Arctopsyche grandis TaxID=121162 RepID=UPI00406D8E89